MTFFELQKPFDMEPIAMTLDAAERSLAAFKQMAASMRAVRDALRGEMIPPDPEMPFTADQREHNARLAHDNDVLERGAWGLGYHDRRLDQFIGLSPHRGTPRRPNEGAPGLKLVENWIAYARKVIERERVLRSIEWPATFRYVGPAGATTIDGRRLRVGDVVTLSSRTQHQAWAHRFERIEQEPVTS
jgi:hypothetical protein